MKKESKELMKIYKTVREGDRRALEETLRSQKAYLSVFPNIYSFNKVRNSLRSNICGLLWSRLAVKLRVLYHKIGYVANGLRLNHVKRDCEISACHC